MFAIRPIHSSESTAVGNWLADLYYSAGLCSAGYRPTLAAVEDRRTAPMTEVYVAEAADGDIVGTVTLTFPGSPYVDVGVDNEAGIRMLGVSAAARGQGLGQELVEFCLDRAQAAGCSGMALLTGAKMVAAQRLYPRLGFTRRPERDKTYDTRTFLCYDRAF